MAKFCDVVGYAEHVETTPGVWENVIVERKYYGDVLSNSKKLDGGDAIVSSFTVGNSISILADAYAGAHFFAIEYIRWAGILWTVSDVKVESPRLILRLGEVYNGPKAGDSDSSGRSARH